MKNLKIFFGALGNPNHNISPNLYRLNNPALALPSNSYLVATGKLSANKAHIPNIPALNSDTHTLFLSIQYTVYSY